VRRPEFKTSRFSLPGVDIDKAARAVSLAQMTTRIVAIVEHVSPGRAVNLLAHDWGCLYGYEFAARHPDEVARLVARGVQCPSPPALQPVAEKID
jgi:pimeloyl-ACP methyl ester carboxylesterase